MSTRMGKKERNAIRTMFVMFCFACFGWAIWAGSVSFDERYVIENMYRDDCSLLLETFEAEYAIVDEPGNDGFIMTCMEHMQENPDTTGREMIKIYKGMEGFRSSTDLLDNQLLP